MQEFVARNGIIALNDSSISGSLTVSGSITANQGFTGSLFGTASHAITASFALAVAGGGGGGLSVNTIQINNQTITVPSGNGDLYVYSSRGVNTFILPSPVGNKNQYVFKVIEGSATIYAADNSLIDDGNLVVIDSPFNSIDISSNNTQYLIY